MTTTVLLNDIDKIKAFVDILNQYKSCDFNLVAGGYKINAKSIMGIFSLDLQKALTLEMDGNTELLAEVSEALKVFH